MAFCDIDMEQTNPKHTGLSRFFVLLLDNLGGYVKANFLCILCFLPSILVAGFMLFISGNVFLVFCSLLVFSPLVGKGLIGLSIVINHSLRDRSTSFCKGFKETWTKSALPGVIYICHVELLIYLMVFKDVIDKLSVAPRIWILFLSISIFLRVVLAYMLPFMVIMELPLRDILKNSMIMVAIFPKQTIGTLFLSGIAVALELLLFPRSILYIITAGIVIQELAKQVLIWPCIDRIFEIDEHANSETIH